MISLIQSREIRDYRKPLDGLVEDFGYVFYHAVLAWCDLIDTSIDKDYWQVYLIQNDGETIGICGLYSLTPETRHELWLGWFGIIPECRSLGFGSEVLTQLEAKAKETGATDVYSYVDADGKPLSFYYRNGYERVSTVEEYLANTGHIFDPDNFESMDDHVIRKHLQ